MSDQIAGLTLHFVSVASGLGKTTIKTIQSRHPELQAPPYSTRAGGARIYFQSFIDWLAKYEGEEAAEKMKVSEVSKAVQPETSETFRLPNGAQLRELNRMADMDRITPLQMQQLLGLAPVFPPSLEAPKLLPAPDELAGHSAFGAIRDAIGDKAARQVAAATARIVTDAVARREADCKQGRLGI